MRTLEQDLRLARRPQPIKGVVVHVNPAVPPGRVVQVVVIALCPRCGYREAR